VTAEPVRLAEPPTTRCFDPFRVLTDAERSCHLDSYAAFQEQRNGAIDLPRRALAARDAYFRELARRPVNSRRAVNHDGFACWQERRGKPVLSARDAMLVIIAKINESEQFGVDLELARFEATGEHLADRKQLHLFLEEGYHSRILKAACATCGIDLQPRKPPWSTRWLIHMVRHLPERARWVPILCGEVVGCTVFKTLIDHTDVFDDEPAVAARIRELLGEIWLDEVMHVAFVRARLGPWAIRFARWLLPIVAHSLTNDVPPFPWLGCTAGELQERLARGIELPPAAEWIEPATA
jgi:hypothetical protein